MILKRVMFTDDHFEIGALTSITEAKIKDKIVEEFLKTDTYQKMIKSIDLDEVKDRVMERLVDVIIESWRRNE